MLVSEAREWTRGCTFKLEIGFCQPEKRLTVHNMLDRGYEVFWAEGHFYMSLY